MAVILCVLLIVLAAILSSPVVVFWGVRSYEKEYKSTKVTVTLCEKDEDFGNTGYPFGYVAVVGGIILICLVPMLLLNLAVAKRLFSQRRIGTERRKQVSETLSTISTHKTSLSNVESRNCSDTSGAKWPISDICDENNSRREVSAGNERTTLESEENPPVSTMGNIYSSKNNKRSKTNMVTSSTKSSRVRRKALIMFILTASFMCTTVLYFTMISILGSAGNTVSDLSDRGKAIFFFFLRFYFIQHIINPILYAILDPKIQRGLKLLFIRLVCRKRYK
ncbi:hypothetical protein ACF0H5_005813 [Mactra antiquata]